jgi:Tfp pilus assembly protein PilZ
MSNQRKNERYACLVPVEGKSRSVFDQARTIDFCKRGLGFVSSHRIPVNKEIPIEIELTDNGKPVFVIGRVQWVCRILNSKNYRIGVLFKDIMKGSKSRLDQYFKEHQED